MSFITSYTVSITTDAGGDGTGSTPAVRGEILTVIYAKDGTSPYADGVDFTIETGTTSQTVWTETNVNASATRVPRQATHSTAGVAATYDGTRAVLAPVFLANETLDFTIAQGGATKDGTFYVLVRQ